MDKIEVLGFSVLEICSCLSENSCPLTKPLFTTSAKCLAEIIIITIEIWNREC